MLFIYRLDYWDLPKGKIEVGESFEEGALREVEEECGVNNLELKDLTLITYHTYEMYDEKCFKTTNWYKMNSDFQGQLVPQLEEGISKVEWMSVDDINNAKKRITINATIPIIILLNNFFILNHLNHNFYM